MYILFGLSWCAVSIGTGAASYKRFISGLVQVSPIFLRFSVSFLELLQVYSYSIVPRLLLKYLFCYGLLQKWNIK